MSGTLPLFARARDSADRTAITSDGESYSYAQLLEDSAGVAAALLDGRANLDGARVCLLGPPGYDYGAGQWGIWRAGGVAVPLGMMHPLPELEYTLEDSGAMAIVADAGLLEKVRPLAESRNLPLLSSRVLMSHEPVALPVLEPDRHAMILYTSGTTSKPKGVVTSHATIQAQITSLVEAWGWTAEDRILHVLPLHHIHGIINVLGCALWSGACCQFLHREFTGIDQQVRRQFEKIRHRKEVIGPSPARGSAQLHSEGNGCIPGRDIDDAGTFAPI